MSINYGIIKLFYRERHLIASMSVIEIKMRYLGTFAGFLWSIVHPITIALIYWFIFSGLFKSGRIGDGVPYICYFLSGFIPWTMFTESLMSSTNSIVNNTHYVKKIVFPTELLPVINLVSCLATQFAMAMILICIMLYFNISLNINILKLFMYFILLCCFTLGLSWITSALNVFYRDVSQILTVILNIWFWLTPLVWVLDIIPPKFQIFIKLNPIFFIVDGYRDSLFNIGMGFYDNIFYFIFNILFIFGVFFTGQFVFYKLKPDFADVL